ncbi:MAG: phage major capsid protein [bacterium]
MPTRIQWPPEPLAPHLESILSELVAYHRSRLEEHQARQTEAFKRQVEGPARLNLFRVIEQLALGARLDDDDRDALERYADRAGIPFDSHRPMIPFDLCRDLTKATAITGGYLVSAETQEARDILRPFSVSARLGIEIESGLRGDQVIPKVTAKTTPAWLGTESSQVTPSQPTLVQIAATPKQVGVVCNISRQLSKQANADLFVRRELLRTAATALDQAVFNGTGAAGQPLGILLTPGIGTTTGTSLGQAGVTEMKRKSAESNAADDLIGFVSTPAIRELLEKRERATGSGYIWDNDRVASRPAFVSTDCPSSTMICGAWPLIWVGIWGPGFVVEINPLNPTHFKTGVIEARILVGVDVAVLLPAAFVKAESIT